MLSSFKIVIIKNIKTKMFQNKNSKKSKLRKKIFSLLNKAMFLLILILGVSYIVSINDLAIKSFVLEDLKIKSKELSALNEKYELKTMNLKSYENIDKRAQELKMVKVDKINYLDITPGFVAKK